MAVFHTAAPGSTPGIRIFFRILNLGLGRVTLAVVV